MQKMIFTLLLVWLLSTFRLMGQTPIDITEQTLKIGATKSEEMHFGFADGDQIIFSFIEIDGKELKEIEIIEYPSTSKFSDYKTAKIENKIINVNKKAVYKFRFFNSSLSGRICKIKIQRIPGSEQTKNFNTNVVWITKQDTTWNTFTKDIIVGYDTTYVQKSKKELIKIDTSITELFNKTERVHSETAIDKTQYANLNVILPENFYAPNKFNTYQSTEVIAWSYWIGVGQKAKEDYEQANNSLSGGITAIGAMTGYGALASFAITGISMFGTPTIGDNVGYKFITVQNGVQKTFDFGNGIAASGRNDNLLQGGFTIQLYNDNFKDGIDVTVKVIAVQLTKQWEDKQYTEQKITSRYEKKIFQDPIILTTKVPITVQ